ncbi:MAG: hypothetical protein NZM07_06235, partial [Elioraea sp.]|nr:hypothetical protein [Elioraea sp.]
NDPEFEPEAFEAIFTASEGVPRRINTLCNRLLLAGYLGEKHRITRADVELVAGEIRDESGIDVPPAPDAPASLQEVARAEAVVRPFAVASINARLDRLEKAINQVLDLLRAGAGGERRPGKTGRQTRSG